MEDIQVPHGNIMNWPKRLHWEEYFQPETVPEALEILKKFGGEAKIIAGGTDVLVQMRRKELSPRVLVDITRIPDMDQIIEEEGLIKIGALVTHSQIAVSPLIREKAFALSKAASHVGSPQIRNLGTITGNLVSGQPGADTAIPLLALDAVVTLTTDNGKRDIPLTEFFVDVGRTVVDSTRDLVTEISFKALKMNDASVYLRLSGRKALSLPILAVSVILSLDMGSRRVNYSKIALGPVTRKVVRAVEAENILNQDVIKESLISEAAKKAAETSDPRDSLLRGCSEYRKAMVENMVERGIRNCLWQLEDSDD